MCVACGKRQAIDCNDAGLCGCHATAVGKLNVDGIGIGSDVVARAVGLGKNSVASYAGCCMLNRVEVWWGGPQIGIIK